MALLFSLMDWSIREHLAFCIGRKFCISRPCHAKHKSDVPGRADFQVPARAAHASLRINVAKLTEVK